MTLTADTPIRSSPKGRPSETTSEVVVTNMKKGRGGRKWSSSGRGNAARSSNSRKSNHSATTTDEVSIVSERSGSSTTSRISNASSTTTTTSTSDDDDNIEVEIMEDYCINRGQVYHNEDDGVDVLVLETKEEGEAPQHKLQDHDGEGPEEEMLQIESRRDTMVVEEAFLQEQRKGDENDGDDKSTESGASSLTPSSSKRGEMVHRRTAKKEREADYSSTEEDNISDEGDDGSNNGTTMTAKTRFVNGRKKCSRSKNCKKIKILVTLLLILAVIRLLAGVVVHIMRVRNEGRTARSSQTLLTPGDLEYEGEPIIGGIDAPVARYPYFVGLWVVSKPLNYCGGTIIDKEWVLTAAHCEVSVGDVAIIGQQTDSFPNGGQNADIRTIDDVYIHPSFDDFLFISNETAYPHGFDAALLHLSAPSTISKPIKLNDKKDKVELFDGDELETIGFGRTNETDSDSYPDTLQTVTLNFVPIENCADAYEGLINIDDTMECAAAPDKDSCQGDSGGPLIVAGSKDDGSEDVLVGIVSFGAGCAIPGFPSVYTKVGDDRLLDWIDDIIKPSKKDKKKKKMKIGRKLEEAKGRKSRLRGL